MATVIDHIVLELGLDPTKFNEAIKKSAETWMKLRQQAEDASKHTEEPVNKMGEAFKTLTTRVLAFAASLFTLQKLTQFSADLVRSNMDLRNLSVTTGISVEKLSKFIYMAEKMGVPIESTARAIAGLDRELKDIQVGGGGDNLLAIRNTLISSYGAQFSKITPDTKALDLLLEIHREMNRIGMGERDKVSFLEKLGYADPALIRLLVKTSTQDLQDMIAKQDDVYKVTQKNIDKSAELFEAWKTLEQKAKSLGQILLHDFHNPILGTIQKVGDMVDKAKEHNEFMKKSYQERDAENRRKAGVPGYTPESQDEINIPPKAKPRSFSRESVTLPGGSETHRGAASFYTGLPSEGGNKTSTGEMVRPDTYTGALQTDLARKYGGLRKGGVWADVTDEKTGKRVRVFLNDTGPLRPGRMVDLSPKAFQEFGPLSKGVIPNLRMDILPPAAPGQSYKGGPVQDNPFDHGAPPIPWLSNPRLLRSPRFNQMLNPTQNYATSEMTVHSMIFNGPNKPITDDAYGLSRDAVPALERGNYMTQMTEGPF